MFKHFVQSRMSQAGTAGVGSLIGLAFIAVGVIIGASFVPSVVTSLVTAKAATGITTAAATFTDIGQLVGVLALAIAPSLAGMYLLFKDIKG